MTSFKAKAARRQFSLKKSQKDNREIPIFFFLKNNTYITHDFLDFLNKSF